MATKNLSEVLDYRCVGCDTKVTPGDTGATYSGRTGFICCPECSEGGVPFTPKLAKALTDRGLWNEHWEAYVNGHGTSPERGMCKHPECFQARPPGRGYCTQQHYMEAEGNAKAAREQAQADYEADHQAERLDVRAEPRCVFVLFRPPSTPTVQKIMGLATTRREEAVRRLERCSTPEEKLIGVARNDLPLASMSKIGLARHFMGEVQKFSIAVRHRKAQSPALPPTPPRKRSLPRFALSSCGLSWRPPKRSHRCPGPGRTFARRPKPPKAPSTHSC